MHPDALDVIVWLQIDCLTAGTIAAGRAGTSNDEWWCTAEKISRYKRLGEGSVAFSRTVRRTFARIY